MTKTVDPRTAAAAAGSAPDKTDPTGLKRQVPPRGFTGRKPFGDGTARTRALTIKISEHDRHTIEQRAARAAMPVTTYCREAALKARVVRGRPPGAPTLSDMAQIAQLSDIGQTIAQHAARLGGRAALPAPALDAFHKLDRLLGMMTDAVEARDKAEAYRQQLLTELVHVGRNLNQITRAVNTMNKRRADTAPLPPAMSATLKDIAALLSRIEVLTPRLDAGDAEGAAE